MPAIFIKTDMKLSFIVENVDPNKIVEYIKDEPYKVRPSICTDFDDMSNVQFPLNLEEIESGCVEAEVENNEVVIDFQAIFKVMPRAQYYEASLDQGRSWYFGCLDYRNSDDENVAADIGRLIRGVNEESFQEMIRGEMREKKKYKLSIKVAKKLKDFK